MNSSATLTRPKGFAAGDIDASSVNGTGDLLPIVPTDGSESIQPSLFSEEILDEPWNQDDLFDPLKRHEPM